MSEPQTTIPGTEPAAPAEPVAPAPTTAPATGTVAAPNPSGEPAPTLGAPTGDPAPTAPVEVTVPDGMDGNLYGVESLKTSYSSSVDAQKAFDHAVETVKGIKAAEESAWTELNQKNIEAIKRDPETGGADFETKITATNRFLEANFSTESRALIAEMGNDLHLVKDLMRLAKHFSEDSAALRGAAPKISDEEQKARDRYPNSPEMWEQPQG